MYIELINGNRYLYAGKRFDAGVPEEVDEETGQYLLEEQDQTGFPYFREVRQGVPSGRSKKKAASKKKASGKKKAASKKVSTRASRQAERTDEEEEEPVAPDEVPDDEQDEPSFEV